MHKYPDAYGRILNHGWTATRSLPKYLELMCVKYVLLNLATANDAPKELCQSNIERTVGTARLMVGAEQ